VAAKTNKSIFMKKINLKHLKAEVNEKLTREQLKNVFGGIAAATGNGACVFSQPLCWNYNCTGDARSNGRGGYECCGPKCE